MCLLVVKPKGVNIEDAYDIEDLCYEATAANPDGWGVSYRDDHGKVQVYKGMIHPKVQVEFLKVLDDREAIIHWRYATGGTKGQFNCHPFQINDESGNPNGAFAHNGVMPIISRSVKVWEQCFDKEGKPELDAEGNEVWKEVEKNLSDTHTVAFCGRDVESIEKWLVDKKMVSSGNKFALMHPVDGIKILGAEHGTWMAGTWFSNTHWKNRYSSLRVFVPKDQSRYFNGTKKHTPDEWLAWMIETWSLGVVMECIRDIHGGLPLMEFPIKKSIPEKCDPCSDMALSKEYEDEFRLLVQEGKLNDSGI